VTTADCRDRLRELPVNPRRWTVAGWTEMSVIGGGPAIAQDAGPLQAIKLQARHLPAGGALVE